MTNTTFSIEAAGGSSKFDDDGRAKRTGTTLTASAHIITMVIGSGVLSLAWAVAQLGWVAGAIALAAFSVITWYMSILLADCYRSPNGSRNYTYKDVVKCYLGPTREKLCWIAQYSNLAGSSIGYAITGSISMAAIKRANCFHNFGHEAGCHTLNNPYILSFGAIQLILSQIPNYHKLSALSAVSAIMSFVYSSIGLGLSIAKIAEGNHVETSLTGLPTGRDLSSTDKMWNIFSAIGDIAFAYSFCTVLVEIQDTIKYGAPENQVMRKASFIGIAISTTFYMACGLLGYAAFGNNAPGNFLTGFGFYEPYWLVDLANLCIAIHLIGAYQICSQPIFQFVEDSCRKNWSESNFICKEYKVGSLTFTSFALVWRTCYVIITTLLAMLFPFFNAFVGLLGSISFWPLTLYFPIEMYIVRAKIPRFSFKWIWLRLLSGICLIASLLVAVGSIQGLIKSVLIFKPFQSVS